MSENGDQIFKNVLARLSQGHDLSSEDAYRITALIMQGQFDPAQAGAYLMGLSQKGEKPDEIIGAARAVREAATTITAPDHVVDCCGTGGDGLKTFNISTAVSIVSAACRIPMAKHGNRAASSKSGTADVLEKLGVPLTDDMDKLQAALHEIGFAFLMAPNHHAALAHIGPVRKSLGFRTIFNLLGPLANPAGAKIQLLGVFDRKWIVPMAECLKALGSTRVWTVHSSDGMDEISLSGDTYVASLKDGVIETFTLTPDDFGLPTYKTSDYEGGTPDENAAALKALLEGQKSAYRDIVLANSAAVLLLSGKVDNIKDGVSMAAATIDDGNAITLLNKYISFVS